jgi:hypothetical protein
VIGGQDAKKRTSDDLREVGSRRSHLSIHSRHSSP